MTNRKSRGLVAWLDDNRLWLGLMVLAILAAAVFTGVGRRMSQRTPEQIAAANEGWETSPPAARDQAIAQGKPILVDFTADWCPPCQYMKHEVFMQAPIRQRITQRFVALRADITAARSAGVPMANQYGVQVTPTLLILDADGQVLARQEGALPPEQLIDWLDAHTPAPATH